MKIVELIQGTPEWHAHRAQHLNASDAPAMMGCSPHKTRAQLVREVATGITPIVDSAMQRIFNAGHRYEALARPLAESIIGEDLFPVTGTEGKFSASFDGLTLLGDTAFEHKSLNDSLRQALVADGVDGSDLPLHYKVQMEHQLLVSGAERVLFMASQWDAEGNLIEEHHCWYVSDANLRARIIAGWEQFERDVAIVRAAQPEPAAAPVVAAPVEGFGALSLRVEGRVLASNLDAFRAGAEAFIARLPKPAELKTDQDFADAEQAVKACAEAEDKIKAAKDAGLAQMADVEAVMRAADTIAATIRTARLALDKAVKAEKEARKAEIVRHYVSQVQAHYASINATMGEHALPYSAATLQAEIAGAMKGKKTLGGITDACDTAAAAAKIEASQRADGIRACVAVLAEFPDHGHLFADRVQLCAGKTPDDLRNLAKARITEYQQREAARQEAERERIRQQEADALARAAAERARQEEQAVVAQPVEHLPSKQDVAGSIPVHRSTIKLGQINSAIGPLSITADGLTQLGFQSIGNDRAAKLYAAADFPAICAALSRVIAGAQIEAKAA